MGSMETTLLQKMETPKGGDGNNNEAGKEKVSRHYLPSSYKNVAYWLLFMLLYHAIVLLPF